MSDLENKLQDQLTSMHADDEGAEPLKGTFAAESGKNVPVDSGSTLKDDAANTSFQTTVISPNSTAASLLPNSAYTGNVANVKPEGEPGDSNFKTDTGAGSIDVGVEPSGVPPNLMQHK